MIKTIAGLKWDAEKRLQDQDPAFYTFLRESCIAQINESLKPDSYDKFNRPTKYVFQHKINTVRFRVELSPLYIYEDMASWAISTYDLNVIRL